MGAFAIWAAAPIYFKAVSHIPPPEVLAHRVLWTVLFVLGICLVFRRRTSLANTLNRDRLLVLVATTVLISTNWLIFIWAIGAGRLVEISLGYYINPLVNVLLALVFLGEALNRRQVCAITVAGAGVAVQVISLGSIPWVSLFLAFSFGGYALLRKKATIDPVVGVLVETTLVAPFALAYVVWFGAMGGGAFGTASLGQDGLLIFSGIITSVPLMLYTAGANRLKFATIGTLQYLVPTCHLLLGTLLYGEQFTLAHAITFVCIWAALALFTYDAVRNRPSRRPVAA